MRAVAAVAPVTAVAAGFAPVLVAFQFHMEVMQHFLFSARVLQILIETHQGNTHDIAVVKLGSELIPRELQPQIVKPADIHRPQPRRVRPKVGASL